MIINQTESIKIFIFHIWFFFFQAHISLSFFFLSWPNLDRNLHDLTLFVCFSTSLLWQLVYLSLYLIYLFFSVNPYFEVQSFHNHTIFPRCLLTVWDKITECFEICNALKWAHRWFCFHSFLLFFFNQYSTNLTKVSSNTIM